MASESEDTEDARRKRFGKWMVRQFRAVADTAVRIQKRSVSFFGEFDLRATLRLGVVNVSDMIKGADMGAEITHSVLRFATAVREVSRYLFGKISKKSGSVSSAGKAIYFRVLLYGMQFYIVFWLGWFRFCPEKFHRLQHI